LRDLIRSGMKLSKDSALRCWDMSFSSVFQRTYTLRAVAWIFISPGRSHEHGRKKQTITGPLPIGSAPVPIIAL
jgi:hypothetical protein